ncbi:ScbA/BarX family gamma-butyrolactone biosynthesis protein [Streptomyces griseiscabiei]|uniref:ScbA/BarX family gamma-butyrolactone biosynthesis protein n=1 Tax=Streptomyces griseiscabiei TaxID=2993540 RepID=A0ABU4LHL4_9ACTN|nr:ScbA/BarX family gamma-butyrolactone biosynthesis protein [Streptomyces griseiscabiei]MBZ3907913.1 gamma-butyrolactone biosynthesis enzyme [Streptomyces griseiscabiei]MDX2915284.1 ScbA/BarX family gamma-butyrolactone biosynthesis protein [Streptomyces griseiscabiei]
MSTQTHAFSVHEPQRTTRTHRLGTIEGLPAAVLRAAPAAPVLTSTVPRELVHRAAVSEVLLTGWEPLDPQGPGERFVVGAQWPRGHCLFAPSGGYQDPMLLVESVRQIGSLLAHAEFSVPFGHQFMMRDIAISTTPELLRATPKPTEVELHTQCRDVVRRGTNLSGMRYDVTVRMGQKALATATASFTCIAPAVYRRLRGDRSTGVPQQTGTTVDPASVGRSGAENVVLTDEVATSGGGRSFTLRVDGSHPVFFDHPVDHIPGMVLLEAARQAAYATTGRVGGLVTGVQSTFTRYAELDTPCLIEAAPQETVTGRTPVRVTGVQGGTTVFTADIILSTPVR